MENFHISKCLTSYFLYISSDGELASAKKFIIAFVTICFSKIK